MSCRPDPVEIQNGGKPEKQPHKEYVNISDLWISLGLKTYSDEPC